MPDELCSHSEAAPMTDNVDIRTFTVEQIRAACRKIVAPIWVAPQIEAALLAAKPEAKTCPGDGSCGATECTETNGHGCRHPVAKAEAAPAAEPSAPAGGGLAPGWYDWSGRGPCELCRRGPPGSEGAAYEFRKSDDATKQTYVCHYCADRMGAFETKPIAEPAAPPVTASERAVFVTPSGFTLLDSKLASGGYTREPLRANLMPPVAYSERVGEEDRLSLHVYVKPATADQFPRHPQHPDEPCPACQKVARHPGEGYACAWHPDFPPVTAKAANRDDDPCREEHKAECSTNGGGWKCDCLDLGPPVTATLSEIGEVPLLCEMATCESCTRTDIKARAILAVHDELMHLPNGTPSCCLVPYPLHRGTSHSYVCDAAVDAVLRVAEPKAEG